MYLNRAKIKRKWTHATCHTLCGWMLHSDKNRKIDVRKRRLVRRFEQADDKFGIINFRSRPGRKMPDSPASVRENYFEETALCLAPFHRNRLSAVEKIPAQSTEGSSMSLWAVVVLWINFALMTHLIGHAQNNGVTADVTRSWNVYLHDKDLGEIKRLRYFRSGLNASST